MQQQGPRAPWSSLGQGLQPKRERVPLKDDDCMLHISCNMMQADLKLQLDRAGFGSHVDFLWFPMKCQERRTKDKPLMHGYAWLNFASVEVAHQAAAYFQSTDGEVPCAGDAQVLRCRLQGLTALKQHIHGKWFPEDGSLLLRHRGETVSFDTVPIEISLDGTS